jgi:hypothetical protein
LIREASLVALSVLLLEVWTAILVVVASLALARLC